MSWSRFSNADVYVYEDVSGGVTCCGCWLDRHFNTKDPDELRAHFTRHVAAGHEVPDFSEAIDEWATLPEEQR